MGGYISIRNLCYGDWAISRIRRLILLFLFIFPYERAVAQTSATNPCPPCWERSYPGGPCDVPTPPKCWGLEEKGRDYEEDCGCLLGVCGIASKHYTHEVPVKVCEGSAGYGSLPHGAVIAEHWQCVGCPDLEAIATAIEDLVNCVTESPEDFAQDVLGAIAEYTKNLAQLGNPAAALAAMDPGTVALLIDDICTCLGGGMRSL